MSAETLGYDTILGRQPVALRCVCAVAAVVFFGCIGTLIRVLQTCSLWFGPTRLVQNTKRINGERLGKLGEVTTMLFPRDSFRTISSKSIRSWFRLGIAMRIIQCTPLTCRQSESRCSRTLLGLCLIGRYRPECGLDIGYSFHVSRHWSVILRLLGFH